MADYIESPQFDAHLVATIQRAFPAHEHEQFIAHYRGLPHRLTGFARQSAS